MAATAAPKKQPSHTWCVYFGLLGLLALQLGLSFALYRYILAVDLKVEQGLTLRRAKRAVDENVVDEANVEFFHPNLRQELEEKDAVRQAATPKSSKDAENPWLYLTSYSRVPVFSYFDKKFVPEAKLQNSEALGVSLFKDKVVLDAEMVRKLKSALALAVKHLRRGLDFDHSILKQCCELLIEVDMNQRSVYQSIFESDFLAKTREFYKIPHDQMEREMAKALVVFRFLREKDMFERYYKQHLAKRLLLKKAADDEWELNMVNKLKVECGFQFVQNLEGMFKDMAYSSALMDAFKSTSVKKANPISTGLLPRPQRSVLQSDTEKNKSDFDMDVKVLSPKNWPLNFPPPACTLPPFALQAFAKYEQFYLQRHQHRLLKINTLLGGADIIAHFNQHSSPEVDLRGPRKYYLSVSTQQMVILDLFNHLDSLSFALGAIQEFCEAALKNCPPGPIGPTGLPGINGEKGDKGDRGDRGLPGESGVRGPPGARGEHGLKGHKGEPGWPGTPGLDGRDGIPGEPGLDGIPGRNGMDGIPGTDGIPGFNGEPGMPGINGTHGKSGPMGPVGPPGPRGPQGIAGPRGRPGKNGQDGTPGLPGISAWTVNGAKANELLIPPSIAGAGPNLVSGKAIVVHESVNVRLRCAASGQPKPDVEWYRLTNSTIPLGAWQAVSVTGHTFNIPKINREHMGIYRCIANNGVPPQANQTFAVEVHFPPLIRIHRQRVSAYSNSTARLECEVEAFPEAIRYWERADGRLLENGDKYRISVIEIGRYKARMQLNITRINSHDYGRYHCISKNELGQTTGVFTVFEVDPRLATPPPIGNPDTTIIGQMPPEHKSMEDLCPAPVCPECVPEPPTKGKCTDGGLSLFDLIGRMEIRQFGNETYPGLPNRTFDCILYAVGKPVFHRFTDKSYGAWMRDSHPRNDIMADKYWVTKEEDNNHLFEFSNKTQYRKNVPSRNYTLSPPFMGNSHVVYNSSFYYNQKNKPHIVRYDMATESARSVELPGASSTDNNKLFDKGFNYVDISVDENGLWVVYGLPENNNTVVVKMDAFTLKREYSWNISVDHHKVGEMFIVCGVLYAVDSVTERDTKIRFALDLYKNMLLDVSLPFTNPFRKTTMISYNARSKELFTWDKGNQLTYPIRYHESGYNSTKEDPNFAATNVQKTDFEIYQTSEAPYPDNTHDQ